MSTIHRLSRASLKSLAEALANKRLTPPFQTAVVKKYVPSSISLEITDFLNGCVSKGMQPFHISEMLRLLEEEKLFGQTRSEKAELVWSGLEVIGSASRDTRIVIQELFKKAQHSIMIASYALDTGKKAKEIFGVLASKMEDLPDLSVRMFVNVPRKYREETSDSILLQKFSKIFRDEIWPGSRYPELFYDPRSLFIDGENRACLHAKCIVVDDELVFITSANFTEAAQERNLEAGILLTNPQLAVQLRSQFETLVVRNILRRVPGV